MTTKEWALFVANYVSAPTVRPADDLPLAEFQRHAAARLAAMMRSWGGALLADAVGLGKTRVALTVAARVAREQRIVGARGPVWLCVPSRLAGDWRVAVARSDVEEFEIVTHTQFSRGTLPAAAPVVLVVDEAHRFRNLGTARRKALIEHATVPILLVTATPVANSIDDLWNLFALFVDDDDVRRAIGWDLATARRLAAGGEWEPMELVSQLTVRRTEPPDTAGFGRRPPVSLRVAPYAPSAAEAWIWSNLERLARGLSLFRDDSEWPPGLFVEHVLRRWESGPDALLETVEELLSFATRRADAAHAGRALDRRSFRALFGPQPEQEVFGFLLESETVDLVGSNDDQLTRDIALLDDLRMRTAQVCAGEHGRDRAIVELAKDGEPLLVFTSYRSAAEGVFARVCEGLGPGGRVGLITGSGAFATGIGRVAPTDLLRRFSPGSHGVCLREHERLQVLVATDCIAEGVNLQDCGRVVLADLPYSPLGVEQRIGRLVRPGGSHDEVTVYLPRPRNWNDSLGMRRRLDAKVGAARRVALADADAGPLAVLTALDRVAALGVPPADLPMAAKLVDAPTSWLTLAQVGDRPWLHVVGCPLPIGETVAELVWSDAMAEACEVPDEVLAALSQRQKFLDAARHAPAAVSLDAPEAVAWAVLVESCEHLGLSQSDLGRLRAKLLRGHRAGIRRQLERVLDTESPARLLRYVGALDVHPEDANVVLVATLGLGE